MAVFVVHLYAKKTIRLYYTNTKITKPIMHMIYQ